MNDTIADLRSLLEEDPSSREFYKLGEALRRTGELDEAAEVLRAGLDHHPRYVAAWVALARLELDRSNLDDVETAARQALDVDSENAVAARLIGEAASRRGDWKAALSAWRLALDLTPGDTELNERLEEAEGRLASGAFESPSDKVFGGDQETAPDALPPELPREVFSFEDAAEPFTVTRRGDTGVWENPEDVFRFGMEDAREWDESSDESLGSESVALEPDVESAGPDASEGLVLDAPEAFGAESVPSQVEPQLRPETPPSGLPLPTVTLAKLAVDQGDLELARRTLEQVVRFRGESEETRELERLLEAAARHGGAGTKTSRKMARLQGWMKAVRLAAESQRHGV